MVVRRRKTISSYPFAALQELFESNKLNITKEYSTSRTTRCNTDAEAVRKTNERTKTVITTSRYKALVSSNNIHCPFRTINIFFLLHVV